MWGDDRFTELTPMKPSGQALWLYLLTGPHCTIIPGLFVGMGVRTLADRLKWRTREVSHHWSEIESLRMAEADWDAGIIWLPKGFQHNEPANPNVVTGWRSVPLPQCDLVRRALSALRLSLWPLEESRVKALIAKGKDPSDTKGWVEAFDEVFGKGFPEAILAGFPEGLGESEARAEAEARAEGSPQPPARRGAVSLRRPTTKERDDARTWLKAVGRCPHEPTCGSHAVCIGRIIYVNRHNELVGMLTEAEA